MNRIVRYLAVAGATCAVLALLAVLGVYVAHHPLWLGLVVGLPLAVVIWLYVEGLG